MRVDLLKGNRTTNLYTINLLEMAYASPICLMARATSTKSWLWHDAVTLLSAQRTPPFELEWGLSHIATFNLRDSFRHLDETRVIQDLAISQASQELFDPIKA
ncbi:hypothetical protein Tco_0957955 [Tanacetum coccineum]